MVRQDKSADGSRAHHDRGAGRWVLRRIQPLANLLVCVLFVAQCHTQPGLLVSVDGLSAEITRLLVTVDRGGKQTQFDVSSSLAKFGVRLPDGVSGPLALAISGHSADGCEVARGGTTLSPTGDALDFARVALAALDAQACHTLARITRYGVAVVKAADGTGTVSSEPAGIACGGDCMAAFSPGTTVTLRARTDASSYFVGWTGACRGSESTCQVAIDDRGAAAGPRQVEAIFAHKICSEGGWCWESPLPQGHTLHSVWASSPSDAWAVGDMGMVLRFDGRSWRRVASGTTASLRAVWGSGPRDVWIVGEDGALLRWDGAELKSSRLGLRTLNSVWGSGPQDVWIVGYYDVIYRWNGAAITEMTSGTKSDLYAVGGSGRSDVWIVGGNGMLLRWDGAKLSTLKERIRATRVWGRAADEVWFFGGNAGEIRWSGGAFTAIPRGSADITGMAELGGEVWAVRESGQIARWDGASFIDVPGAAPLGLGLNALCRAGDSESFVVGAGGYIGRIAGGRLQATSTHMGAWYSAAWGSAEDDVWVVGAGGVIAHWDGAHLTRLPSTTRMDLYGVWGDGRGQVWAVGDFGTMARWDGSRLLTLDTQTTLPLQARSVRAIWGSAANDIWIAGTAGLVARWDGARLTTMDNALFDTRGITGICGKGPAEVWFLASWDGEHPDCVVATWDGSKFVDRGCPGAAGDALSGTLHCPRSAGIWLAGFEAFKHDEGVYSKLEKDVSSFYGAEDLLAVSYWGELYKVTGTTLNPVEHHGLYSAHLGGSTAGPWLLGRVGNFDFGTGTGALLRRHPR